MIWRLMCLTVQAAVLAGCASLDVTPVTNDNDATVKGVRYCLPKPFIQATPQADGTIAVDVLYLPDRKQCYAIDSSSQMSSYTFKFSRDEKGLLTAIEYKGSTMAVGQQLAASAAAAEVQTFNIKAAQAAAVQTAVNMAQTAVDAAQSAADAAQATLMSDTASAAALPAGAVPSTTLAADAAAVAAANAKLQVAKQALDRTRSTAQAVAITATAGSPVTTTGPTMGTAFGQPTWNSPINYSLPDAVGPVLYTVNDRIEKDAAGKPLPEVVELVAVKANYPSRLGVEHYPYEQDEKGVTLTGDAQPTFATTTSALGPPMLLPSSQIVPAAAKQVTFLFDRPITGMIGNVFKDAATPVDTSVVPTVSDDKKAILVDTSKLKAGIFIVKVTISYSADSAGHTGISTQSVKFQLN
jgi:hypothetical protein